MLLALSLPVLAEAEPGAEAAYNARHQKCGFTSSLDGVPGKYVRGLNEDGTYDLINCGYHPGDAAQTWLQFSSNGKTKHVRWPDSIFSVRFTFTLPNTDGVLHRSSSARGIF